MNNEVFSKLMYSLTKHAARESWMDFLENCEIDEEDYIAVRDYLMETYGIKTYL